MRYGFFGCKIYVLIFEVVFKGIWGSRKKSGGYREEREGIGIRIEKKKVIF